MSSEDDFSGATPKGVSRPLLAADENLMIGKATFPVAPYIYIYICPVRLQVRSSAFHAAQMGSIPIQDTIRT